ncbi:MAG: L,D-transpeptidase family protein [Phycisphaerales bacterium]|nr:L,D-transpeptidase family protein [Phycisphaerales bacterium]
MALPSQMQSSPVRGRYVYRRKRRRRGPAALVAIVVIVGLGVWLAFGWGSPAPTQADENTQATLAPEPPPIIEDRREETSLATRRAIPPAPPIEDNPVIDLPQWTPDPIVNERVEPAEPIEPIETTPPAEVADWSTTPPPARPAPTGSGPLGLAEGLVAQGRLVEARALLTQAIDSDAVRGLEASDARMMLGQINEELVFGPRVYPEDTWAVSYEVRPGDSLSRIVSTQDLEVDWRLLQYVNGMARPESLRVGQSIKLVRGPFHAEVDKATHRMDLYMGEGPERVFVRSYEVGLGAHDSTPLGRFKVKKGRKVVNPTWVNPQTGEFYPADDPDNPLGEYWLGLAGLDPTNRDERSFGIHGTIEPDTIGTDASMGCIRLRDGEIDMVYAVLAEGVSTVDVRQ